MTDTDPLDLDAIKARAGAATIDRNAVEDEMTDQVHAILSELIARADYDKAVTVGASARRIVRELDAVDHYVSNLKFRADHERLRDQLAEAQSKLEAAEYYRFQTERSVNGLSRELDGQRATTERWRNRARAAEGVVARITAELDRADREQQPRPGVLGYVMPSQISASAIRAVLAVPTNTPTSTSTETLRSLDVALPDPDGGRSNPQPPALEVTADAPTINLGSVELCTCGHTTRDHTTGWCDQDSCPCTKWRIGGRSEPIILPAPGDGEQT